MTKTSYRSIRFSSVAQSCLTLYDPMDSAHQAFLSITNCRSLLKLLSMEEMMPSSHLIICRPLLFLPSIFPNIRVFSKESDQWLARAKGRGEDGVQRDVRNLVRVMEIFCILIAVMVLQVFTTVITMVRTHGIVRCRALTPKRRFLKLFQSLIRKN